MKKLIISLSLIFSYVLAFTQNMPAYWVPTTGTNTYTVNITGFTSGYTFKVAWVSFTNGNTGASTIVIGPNNVSAAPIRKWDGDSWEPLVSGDIPTITGGARAILTYNNSGSFFELNLLATTEGGVESVTGQGVDNTDPANPVISGLVESVSGDGVDNSDPANPVMSFSSLTASNGVIRTGDNFALGGDITSDVTIDSDVNGSHQFDIGGTRPFSLIRIRGGISGTNSGTFNVSSTHTNMTRTVAANTSSIQISSTGFLVTDNIASKGLVYNADYSAGATARQIMDKGYIDLQAGWPLNGTKAFTGNSTISGGGFNATIGQSGDRMGNFRVWSNGTVGLDGVTSTFMQSGDNTATVDATGGMELNLPDGDFVVNTTTVEMNVDTDYRFYNTANNNYISWGSGGVSMQLDDVNGGDFSVNDSDSPLFSIGADGAVKFYTIPEYDAAPTLTNDLQLTHKGYVDTKAPLAMPAVTYTVSHVGDADDDIGVIIYMNVSSANTFTITSGEFPVGTFLNVKVVDEATTAVAGAGVTINPQSGSLVLSSSGLNVFYQSSANVWELYNGSPFTVQNTTFTGLRTWTLGGYGFLLSGGDWGVTGNGGYQLTFDDDNGTNIDFPTNGVGDIYYRAADGYLERLAVGTNGEVLKLVSGLPSWESESGGVSDGDKGDITVSGSTWTVDNSAITYAKMQNAAGGTRIIGRAASSAGVLNEIVFTADGQVLRRSGGTLGPGAVDLADTDAVTGVLPTANGGSLSGTYTPTLTNVANLDGSTAYACQYMRVGNVVTVSGRFDVDITTISTLTQLDISLPIASALTAANQAGGTASTVSSVADHAGIMADATNDRVSVIWNTTSASAFSMFFSFTYLVQ